MKVKLFFYFGLEMKNGMDYKDFSLDQNEVYIN